MSTARQLISNIRSSHKILSNDSLLNDRSILCAIQSASRFLIKRETNLRKLWATDSIFQTIPCLEMIEVPISECCDYVDPLTVSRSRYPLPRMAEGNYQYVIQGVWSINAMGGKGKEIKYTTIRRYMNLLKLPVVKKEIYFWVINGYLYISNPLLKSVRIAASFEEDIPNEILFPDCDCGKDYPLSELCKNPLDREYPLPGYLEEPLSSMVSKNLMSTYFKLREDHTNEGIDGQSIDSQLTN